MHIEDKFSARLYEVVSVDENAIEQDTLLTTDQELFVLTEEKVCNAKGNNQDNINTFYKGWGRMNSSKLARKRIMYQENKMVMRLWVPVIMLWIAKQAVIGFIRPAIFPTLKWVSCPPFYFKQWEKLAKKAFNQDLNLRPLD